jgi:hypothetical protein
MIAGDLSSSTHNGVAVDDLLIGASSVLDGRGNMLGQTRPDHFRSGSRLPYQGALPPRFGRGGD